MATITDEAAAAEAALEAALSTGPAHEWAVSLRDAVVLVEPVVVADRDRFRRGILDDPVNRQLGRVVSYSTRDWGHFEQIGPLLRHGPDPRPRAPPDACSPRSASTPGRCCASSASTTS